MCSGLCAGASIFSRFDARLHDVSFSHVAFVGSINASFLVLFCPFKVILLLKNAKGHMVGKHNAQ